jgi:Sulfotransferase domain
VGKTAFGGWHTVDVDEVTALKRRVDRTRFVPRLALPTRWTRRRADLARYAEMYRKVYAAVAEVSGAPVVIDSSKHASLAFALGHHPDLDMRVLHLVRDGRGVAYSWSKHVTRPEVTEGDPLMPRYSTTKSATLWTAQNGLFHLLSTDRTPVLRMRYEELVADPRAGLARIREFLDLPPDPFPFLRQEDGATVAQFGTTHSVAGNPMRFQTGPVALQRDNAWRTAMPAGRRRVVTALTWPGRLRYGYLDHHREHRSGS